MFSVTWLQVQRSFQGRRFTVGSRLPADITDTTSSRRWELKWDNDNDNSRLARRFCPARVACRAAEKEEEELHLQSTSMMALTVLLSSLASWASEAEDHGLLFWREEADDAPTLISPELQKKRTQMETSWTPWSFPPVSYSVSRNNHEHSQMMTS